VAAHQQVGAAIVLVWDNLAVHKMPPMQAFIDAHANWLTVFYLPTYGPDLNRPRGSGH
jgi:transposase